jgi:hypothetical protein
MERDYVLHLFAYCGERDVQFVPQVVVISENLQLLKAMFLQTTEAV